MMYAPSTTLLNLGHVELEETIQPCDEFLAARLRGSSVHMPSSQVGREHATALQSRAGGGAIRANRDSPILLRYT